MFHTKLIKIFMLASGYLVTIVTSNSELSFLCEIPHFEPHLRDQVVKGWYIMQAVKPASISMMNCNRKCKYTGKWIVCATNF